MLTKQYQLAEIELAPQSGIIFVSLTLLTYDGVIVVENRIHTFSFDRDYSDDDLIANIWNYLTTNGFPGLTSQHEAAILDKRAELPEPEPEPEPDPQPEPHVGESTGDIFFGFLGANQGKIILKHDGVTSAFYLDKASNTALQWANGTYYLVSNGVDILHIGAAGNAVVKGSMSWCGDRMSLNAQGNYASLTFNPGPSSAYFQYEVAQKTLTWVQEGNSNFASFPNGDFAVRGKITASNMLEDYSSGTFTPIPQTGGVPVPGILHATGYYVRIGKIVHFNVHIEVGDAPVAPGVFLVTGLPYPNLIDGAQVNFGMPIGLGGGYGNPFVGTVNGITAGFTGPNLYVNFNQGTVIQQANIPAGAQFAFSGTYQIAL